MSPPPKRDEAQPVRLSAGRGYGCPPPPPTVLPPPNSHGWWGLEDQGKGKKKGPAQGRGLWGGSSLSPEGEAITGSHRLCPSIASGSMRCRANGGWSGGDLSAVQLLGCLAVLDSHGPRSLPHQFVDH